MAHSAPTFASGTIPSGASVVQDFLDEMVSRITAFQSNGEQAWEKADSISETWGTFDLVFHSVGDRSLGSGSNKGDTDIWVRWFNDSGSTFRCQIMQDYAPSTHSTFRAQPGSGNWLVSMTTDAIDWWLAVNEYNIVIVMVQGSNRRELYVGELIRIYSAGINGRGRITSQSGTGNGVVFGVDRDISGQIKVGQRVSLVNQTPDGVSLQTVGIDIATVVAVSSNSITLDNIVRTYAVGSLVGLDCQPVFVFNNNYATGQMPHKVDGGNYSPIRMEVLFKDVIETDLDPLGDGSYNVMQMLVRDTGAGYRIIRGKMELIRAIVEDPSMVGDVDDVAIEGGTEKWHLVDELVWTDYMLLMGPK